MIEAFVIVAMLFILWSLVAALWRWLKRKRKPVVVLVFLIAFFHLAPALAEDVVPVKEGATAPYTGMLVKEGRFTKMLDAELAVEDLTGRLRIQEKLTNNLETMYTKRIEEAASPPKWYETPSFNRWLGFFIGVAVTASAIWGASELVKAVR